MNAVVVKAVIGRGRHGHIILLAVPFEQDDDVLLEHIIVPEGLVAGGEQMQMTDGSAVQVNSRNGR